MTLAMLALLVGLGNWQVRRLAWKRGVLAAIAAAEAAPAVPLPAAPSPFQKVSVTGSFRPDLAALFADEVCDTPRGPVIGGELIVPLERPGALAVLVDRGWIPLDRRGAVATPAGSVTVVGYVHPADHPGPFSARDDAAGRRFYTLDPPAIGAALGLPGVAPFVLIALGDPPAAGYPVPARHLPQPPNNHLQYAITWYGLAACLLVIFAAWSRQVLRA
ncbi:MAG: SURF1 family protein [Acidisphaera sp.]|nr:SURF1 family protein [Acidisphaera sp.]